MQPERDSRLVASDPQCAPPRSPDVLPPAFFAGALEHIPLIVMAVNPQGVVVYANRTAHVMLGVENLTGCGVDAFLFDAESRALWDELRRRLSQGDRVRGAVNLLCVDGREMACELDATPDISQGGQLFTLVLRDTTAELGHARSIEEKNIQMARMNAELIRSNAELQRVSELKTKFLSIASHELKTPLTLIKGYSDIIIDTMRGKLDDSAYAMVTSINRAADRLHRVVNNILDATRIEKGRLRLSVEPMDLADDLRECVGEFNALASRRMVTFVAQIAPELPAFTGDRLRFQQVFANLLSNALKFSPDKSTVTVSLNLNGEGHFHLAVHDQGIGVPPEEQPRIFQPFYEMGSVTHHSSDQVKFLGGGTGLGLFIVKGIVDRHGGYVWVESSGRREAEYPGSTFHVVLPLRSPTPLDSEPSVIAATLPPIVAEDAPTVRKLVLVVDPDGEAAEVARMALEPRFEVLVVKDGGAAVAAAFERMPDAVLLERELAVLDGYRVCRLIRSLDETGGAAVAFYSAWTGDEIVSRCFACGAHDYLIKPLSLADLHMRVSRMISRKSARSVGPGIT